MLDGESSNPANRALRSHPVPDADGQDAMEEGEARARQEREDMETGDAGNPEPELDAVALAQRLRDVQAQLTAARTEADQANTARAQLESAVLAATGGSVPPRPSRTPASVDLTKVVNRPCNFDGSVASRFHEWKNEVQMYLRVMKFPKDQEAGIVQSYLRGTALAWYMQKITQLESAGMPVPTSWNELLPLLNERFEHRNPEVAARDKLMTLRQGNMTMQQYLKEFEACYAFILKWDEADKIHRFIYGLKPHLRIKFCVNPATHSWWTNFDNLVSYITSYMSDDLSHTECVTDAMGTLSATIQTGAASTSKYRKNPRWQKKPGHALSQKQISTVLNALGLQSGRVAKPQRGAGSAKRQAPKVYTTANGESVQRSSGVRSFCHTSQPPLCLGCYQPGHKVAECTAAVATGTPGGYSSR
jgi:hypothetical protein